MHQDPGVDLCGKRDGEQVAVWIAEGRADTRRLIHRHQVGFLRAVCVRHGERGARALDQIGAEPRARQGFGRFAHRHAEMQFEMVDAVRRSDPCDGEGGGVAGTGRLDRHILQRSRSRAGNEGVSNQLQRARVAVVVKRLHKILHVGTMQIPFNIGPDVGDVGVGSAEALARKRQRAVINLREETPLHGVCVQMDRHGRHETARRRYAGIGRISGHARDRSQCIEQHVAADHEVGMRKKLSASR